LEAPLLLIGDRLANGKENEEQRQQKINRAK